LLLLGAPGTGKSTSLRELARELLLRAEQDPTHPLPVIINLSSWATKKLPLEAWLVEQVQLVYGLPRHLSQEWITQEQFLFLLDGLDEVKASARGACIDAINAYREVHFMPLVMCSRSREYLEQEQRLRVPYAVEIQSLTPEQAEDYLRRIGKSMAAVRTVLRSNRTLRDLVTTPLMLNVVMLTYRSKTTKDLPQLGSAEEQQQIFDHYVMHMLSQQTRKWHYSSQQTRNWLVWLAQQMKQRSLTEFYLEHLQPTWLPTKLLRIVFFLSYGLAAGLAFGLAFGLLPQISPKLSLQLLSGLLFGLGMVLNNRQVNNILLVENLTWRWKFLLLWPTLGLLAGLILALFYGLFVWLFVGLLLGLFLGLSPARMKDSIRLRPNQGVQKSVWNALRLGLLFGLIFGLSVGLVFGPVFGLLTGLSSGLLFMIGFGGGDCLAYYFLRYLLWQHGAIPWHYVRFLEESTERILLQRIGGGYCFIHPLFLDYFASLNTALPPHAAQQPSSPQP
jgi:DNA polymerase III delta prime subunit